MSLRPGIDQTITNALAAAGITTCYLLRLDFQSEAVGVWTGNGSIQPTMSGDSMLDNIVFDELSQGVTTQIGDNAFSMEGSETFQISLAIPTSPSAQITAAMVHPSEFQARPATIWRGLLIRPSNPLAAPAWVFRRIRSGAMDKIEVIFDGQSHIFTLSIESHAALISSASQSTYMDQDRFDPADTSQRYAVSIANGGLSQTDGGYTGTRVGASTPVGRNANRYLE